MITHIGAEGGSGRVPSGAVQFKNDWPGVFIRDDDAIATRMCILKLKKLLHEKCDSPLPHKLSWLTEVIERDVIVGGVKDREDSLYEIVDGERRQIAPMGVLSGALASLLAGFINFHALPRKLGIAIVEALFHLKEGRPSRRPDIAFVAQDRWASVAAMHDDPAEFQFPPNLAIEVISPSNTAKEIEEKIIEYFDAGVALVWIIHPIPRRIYVHQSPSEVRVLGAADELDGGEVIPGFRLKIQELFAAVDGLV